MAAVDKVVYIDGMACLGKSTVIQKISMSFPKVKTLNHDYYEYITFDKNWKEKYLHSHLNLLYTANNIYAIEEGIKDSKFTLVDRHPVATMAYDWVFSNKSIDVLEETFPSKQNPVLRRWCEDDVIIAVSSNAKGLNERIRLRGRFDKDVPLSFHEREYEVYTFLSDYFNWTLFDDSELTDFSIQDRISASIIRKLNLHSSMVINILFTLFIYQ